MAKKKSNAGRPKIEIDWDVVDVMLEYGATCVDIAKRFTISEDTVQRKVAEKHKMLFSEYKDSKFSGTLQKLRQKQLSEALAGNTALLIWAGKQFLGQSEKKDITQHTIEESYEDFIARTAKKDNN